jgi:hypothetical protein
MRWNLRATEAYLDHSPKKIKSQSFDFIFKYKNFDILNL